MALVDLLGLPHFPIMLIGVIFLTLAILMVILHKPKKWFLLHTIFSIIGIALAITGLIILSGLILGIPHAILGLIVVIFLVGELFSGAIARKMKNRKIRTMHIWVSRVIYIISLVVIVLGIINYI